MNLCEARLLSNESLICKEQRKNEKGSWQDSLRTSIGNITSSDRTTSAKDSLQYCGKIDVSIGSLLARGRLAAWDLLLQLLLFIWVAGVLAPSGCDVVWQYSRERHGKRSAAKALSIKWSHRTRRRTISLAHHRKGESLL